MTTTVGDALDLVQAVRRSGLGVPASRTTTRVTRWAEAREMVAVGELGLSALSRWSTSRTG